MVPHMCLKFHPIDGLENGVSITTIIAHNVAAATYGLQAQKTKTTDADLAAQTKTQVVGCQFKKWAWSSGIEAYACQSQTMYVVQTAATGATRAEVAA